MSMKVKYLQVPVTDFKYDDDSGTFTCYGNTKHNIDRAGDRPMDGCYTKSIAKHMEKGTMPKMLWSHDPTILPVGSYSKMEEDAKGLKMTGKLSETSMGKDIKILAKDNALDSFSIGYVEVESEYDSKTGINNLIELDIKEISWVNFPCDENAQLEAIKSNIADGELPTKRELQKLLRNQGLSKSQAEKIANHYDPKGLAEEVGDIFEQMVREQNTKEDDIFDLMEKVE